MEPASQAKELKRRLRLLWVSLFDGMERWTGMMEWNGME